MPRFFIDGPVDGGHVLLTGGDARHIAGSLRMRPGESLVLCDRTGLEYVCEMEWADGTHVQVKVLETRPNESEPPVKVRLFQALPKGDKLEYIVQKAVELGVDEIVPVLTARCVSRPDAKAMAKKQARLQKIAEEAAKQSGRGKIPPVLPLCGFREAVQEMRQADLALFLYERADKPLRGVLRPGVRTAAVFVGSEGGFSPEEAQYAAEQGVVPVSLGKRILRCETAPVCALSIVFYACEAL